MRIVKSTKNAILPVDWFERHLNWTAVIITVSGFILSVLAVFASQGFVIIGLYNSLQIPFEFSLYLVMSGILATFISVIGMIWVIRKKTYHYGY